MEIISSFGASTYGMMKSQQLLSKTAQKVATQEGEPADNMVHLISAQEGQSANVEVVKTADEMLKELMNMSR